MKTLFAGLVALSLLPVFPAQAQSTSFADTMSVCTSVISEQYNSSSNPPPRWGECVAAVQTYLTAIGAISAKADPAIGDLIAALTELYQEDPTCKIRETELPLAISTAAASVFAETVKAEYLLIGKQISGCNLDGTAAINSAAAAQASPA